MKVQGTGIYDYLEYFEKIQAKIYKRWKSRYDYHSESKIDNIDKEGLEK